MLLLAVPAAAQTETQPTGLPLPRFASLRADEVNVRTGPGPRYPVEWVFVRRNMPVEIVAEFDTWRRIRDWQGTEGWAHKSMLSGHRTVMMQGEVRTLRREPTEDSPAVARAETGVVGSLEACDSGWCRVEISGFEGWLKSNEFWGVYPDERIK
ncbi:MAG: SH3 domain-containing protein [Proteobacteria bacterium]|nr:SH3 domain-containing protein [Pseudomonadota bacterium]